MGLLRSDLPLGGDGSARFLPWIIGCMVYLAALALRRQSRRPLACRSGRPLYRRVAAVAALRRERGEAAGHHRLLARSTRYRREAGRRQQKAALLQPWLGGIELLTMHCPISSSSEYDQSIWRRSRWNSWPSIPRSHRRPCELVATPGLQQFVKIWR
jgi:hypothetical protein